MEEGIVASRCGGDKLASGVGVDEIQNSVTLSESRLLLDVRAVLLSETSSNKSITSDKLFFKTLKEMINLHISIQCHLLGTQKIDLHEFLILKGHKVIRS